MQRSVFIHIMFACLKSPYIVFGKYVFHACLSFQCLSLWAFLSIPLVFFFSACSLLSSGVHLSSYCISTPQENQIKIFCLLQIKFCLFFHIFLIREGTQCIACCDSNCISPKRIHPSCYCYNNRTTLHTNHGSGY